MHGIETAFIARVDTDTIEVKTSQPGKPGPASAPASATATRPNG